MQHFWLDDKLMFYLISRFIRGRPELSTFFTFYIIVKRYGLSWDWVHDIAIKSWADTCRQEPSINLYQWCAIPAIVDSNSIPIPDQTLQFNSDSNSTLENISSIPFQFQFHPWKYELNSIPIPIPRNFDSNSDSVSTHKNHTSMMSSAFLRIRILLWIQVVGIWIWIQISLIPEDIVIYCNTIRFITTFVFHV